MVTVPALSYGLWRVWSPPSPSDPHPVGWGCLPPPPKPLFPQTFCPAAQRQALHRGTQHSSWGAHQQAMVLWVATGVLEVNFQGLLVRFPSCFSPTNM